MLPLSSLGFRVSTLLCCLALALSALSTMSATTERKPTSAVRTGDKLELLQQHGLPLCHTILKSWVLNMEI